MQESSDYLQKEKRVVLVSGASRGIGRAVAQHLAKQGCVVYGTSRQNSLSHERIKFMQMDVTSDSSVSRVIKAIIHTEGQLDIVINSAALGLYGPAEEVSITQAKCLFDVNVFGIMRVMQHVLPHFRKQGHGLIINISSMAALDPVPGSDWYASSKYALEGLTECMASYLQESNIKLVLVEPGPVNTQFIEKTSEVGSIELPDKPYGEMGKKVFDWHRDVLSKGQDPQEIALLIEKIIHTPSPLLRYQTSPAMQKIAKKRYVDPTGKSFLKSKRSLLKILISDE